ncbi:hypothetical protein HOD29_06460 [archaeon]|jgi:uncharacterized membrane protein (UPF0127 family)|nr:hypothetical protein [archaeon]
MKKKQIGLNYKRKRIEFEVNFVPRRLHWLGLMFSRKKKAEALLFEFDKLVKMPIHSCFVFYNFYAIWLDENFNFIEGKVVNPFRLSVSPKKKFKYLIEVPITKNYDGIIKLLVGEKETFK